MSIDIHQRPFKLFINEVISVEDNVKTFTSRAIETVRQYLESYLKFVMQLGFDASGDDHETMSVKPKHVTLGHYMMRNVTKTPYLGPEQAGNIINSIIAEQTSTMKNRIRQRKRASLEK